jgi:hypothetical protein
METRETRDFAREIKFKTQLDKWPDIVKCRARISSRMGTAPASMPTNTRRAVCISKRPKFDVYRRSGSYGKSKFRIRRYGAAPIMFLERKFRTNGCW